MSTMVPEKSNRRPRGVSVPSLGRGLVFILAACQLACVPDSFTTHVSGLDGQVAFTFHESEDSATPSPQRIVSFSVWELAQSGSAAEVWRLEGAASLSALSYGAAPVGLDVIVAPRPLARTAKYVAQIVHRSSSSRRQSSVAFSFGEDGILLEAADAWAFGPSRRNGSEK
jgi:hypothetical protein